MVNDGASSSGPAGGLTPAQLASAYGYQPNAGGAGQTVAVVEAFNDPKIEADLGEFDREYGLPTCNTADDCLETVGQTGSTTSLPESDVKGWSVETSLDVETVHSACPSCKILIVEADSPSYSNLATAVNEAVQLGATEVSNSYGGPEAGMGAFEQAAYNHPGVVITGATGDDGYYDWDLIDELVLFEGQLYFGASPEMPNVPASLPSVVAVGGTTLALESDGARASETVWNNNGPGDRVGLSKGFAQGATGGGCSERFTAQAWQQSTPGFANTGCGTKRLAADISADANPLTGFDIYDSYDCGAYCERHGVGKGWITIGGTSLSTPLISSLYALAGGSDGVNYPALTLYGRLGEESALYDVTQGANGFCGGEAVSECGDPNGFFGLVDCEGTTACNAAVGFDGPSGLGAPNGLSLFKPQLPSAVATPPSSPKAGLSATFSGGASSDPYPGGSISSYTWSWGDGTPSSGGASPTHTYAAPGEYTVTLVVTDNYGLTSAPVKLSVDVAERTTRELEEEVEAKKKAEEEAIAKKAAEEAAATKRAEEGAAQKKAEEEEEAAKKVKAEEEAAAKKKAEGEALATSPTNAGSQGVSGFQASLPPPAPVATLASTSLQMSSSGAVTLKVSCPVGESSCSGTVTLRTLDAVVAGAVRAASTKPAVLTLAVGSFTVPGGQARVVTLHLSGKARALLTRSRTLRARATLLAHDPRGASHTTQTIVTLHAPRLQDRTG